MWFSKVLKSGISQKSEPETEKNDISPFRTLIISLLFQILQSDIGKHSIIEPIGSRYIPMSLFDITYLILIGSRYQPIYDWI